MSDKPVFVTKPDLPPLEEFIPYLEKIWETSILTNGGPFHKQLEKALCDYLQVDHIALFANGTLALMTALKALKVSGEVITTPYSFVATTHALLWNGLTPVFVDIDPDTLNLDAKKLETAITPTTAAIMPVHCYGNPCDVSAIKEIADKYNLQVIYDAAHAFGVRDQGGSILRHGDLSILSFHATKVFNTLEGGAIICPDAETKQRVDHLKNFGIVDQLTVVAAGINGKMNEICAAFGLLQLENVDDAIASRRKVDEMYRELLRGIPGIQCIELSDRASANYSYFPILVDENYVLSRDGLYDRLKQNNILARRYFYPLISEYPMYSRLPSSKTENLAVSLRVSEQVLCLPIYSALTDVECREVAGIVAEEGQRLR